MALKFLIKHDSPENPKGDDHFNPSALRKPRFNHFVAFMLYFLTCWAMMIVIPILWVIIFKTLRIYLYLPGSLYVFIYTFTPAVVVFYSALIFQAACYDVDSFLRPPRVVFIKHPYVPNKKNVIKYLSVYLIGSYALLFCFYLVFTVMNGTGIDFQAKTQTLPHGFVDFYKQGLGDIISQQVYRSYSFIRTNFISNMFISIGVLFIAYILTLAIGYGREVFYPLIKTFQRDLWNIAA